MFLIDDTTFEYIPDLCQRFILPAGKNLHAGFEVTNLSINLRPREKIQSKIDRLVVVSEVGIHAGLCDSGHVERLGS